MGAEHKGANANRSPPDAGDCRAGTTGAGGRPRCRLSPNMSQVTEKKEHLSAKDAKDAKKSGRKMTGAANATQSSRPSAIFASFAFFASFADKKSSRHDCHPV
jgi:hypothetical protein